MSDIAQLITSIAILITAITGVIVSLRNGQKLIEVHKATNGMAEKMGAAREAKGLQEGRAENKSV